MAMKRSLVAASVRARASYIALSVIFQRPVTTSTCVYEATRAGQFRRSDFSGQGFTGYYEPGGPTAGPLGDASAIGAPTITPKVLKHHLDQYVIGQERAKKVLTVAVYNHYQRIQELQRREEEEEELLAQQARRAIAGRHPVEDEFPGQQPTVNTLDQLGNSFAPTSLLDQSELKLEKSNVLLLGPSGVGKTLMTKTLAKVLDVPFSISDCTPFTQAGYIGEDADVCVQRLLAAADYDVAKAERGIICLDEIDKIATAKVSHGKDVSGEGVQQALLKIIEGTVVQVQAKQERGSTPGAPPLSSSSSARPASAIPTSGLGTGHQPISFPHSTNQQQAPQRGEVYNVDTSNILFICTGAFVGLHRLIMDRIAKGSIGFGARVSTVSSSDDSNDTSIRAGVNSENDELFRKNLPFYTAPTDTFAPAAANPSQTQDLRRNSESQEDENNELATYNSLDLAAPADLQRYGLIPELIGRIPVTCSVSQLSLSALVRVLTEPRNSILEQYRQLFALSGVELQFTAPALHEVARTAQGMGTGARGLRTVMERLLSEAMFEAPGSGIRYCLVTEKAALKEEPVLLLGRGMQSQFRELLEREEEKWRQKRGESNQIKPPKDDGNNRGDDGEQNQQQQPPGFTSFEEYRQRVKVACAGGAF